MRLLRTMEELVSYLERTSHRPGCFADTGFLYALAYDDDRLHGHANEILDLLYERKITIYANVITAWSSSI